MLVNYYQILEIPKDASGQQIKTSYRQKAMLMHPDVNKSEDSIQSFILVKQAYEVLIDPISRIKYDRLLELSLDEELQIKVREDEANYKKYGKSKGYESDEKRQEYADKPSKKKIVQLPILEKAMLVSFLGLGVYGLYLGITELLTSIEERRSLKLFGLVWASYLIVLIILTWIKYRGNPFVKK